MVAGHSSSCRGGEEEGFGLLLICYVSDLSKKVACGGREIRSAAFARVRRAIHRYPGMCASVLMLSGCVHVCVWRWSKLEEEFTCSHTRPAALFCAGATEKMRLTSLFVRSTCSNRLRRVTRVVSCVSPSSELGVQRAWQRGPSRTRSQAIRRGRRIKPDRNSNQQPIKR